MTEATDASHDIAAPLREQHNASPEGGDGAASPVPGTPAAARTLAESYSTLADGLEQSGQSWRAIDTGAWTGKAADAARDHLDTAPKEWLRAADSFGQAARALHTYAGTLAEVKPRAERAQQRLEQAQAQSHRAHQEHQAAVDAFNQAAAQANNSANPSVHDPGRPPGPLQDPAAAEAQQARVEIEQCQQAASEAAHRAAQAVRQAAEAAPADASGWSRLAQEFGDFVSDRGNMVKNVAHGAGDALVSTVQMISAFGPSGVTSPAAQTRQEIAGGAAAGLMQAWNHPGETAKAAVSSFADNPAKGVGGVVGSAPGGGAVGGGLVGGLRGMGRLGRLGRKPGGSHTTPTSEAPTAPPPREHGLNANGDPLSQQHAPDGSGREIFVPGRDQPSMGPDTRMPASDSHPSGPDSRPEVQEHRFGPQGSGQDTPHATQDGVGSPTGDGHPGYGKSTEHPVGQQNDPWGADSGGDIDGPVSWHVQEHGDVPGQQPDSHLPQDRPQPGGHSEARMRAMEDDLNRMQHDLDTHAMPDRHRAALEGEVERYQRILREAGG